MSEIIESLRDDLASLYRMGVIDEATLRDFHTICPQSWRALNAEVKTNDQSV